MTHWYLMRHAHAVDGDPMDAERSITKKGAEQCADIRGFLDAIGVTPELIITSTMNRSIETAEAMYGNDILILHALHLDPDDDPEDAWGNVLEITAPGVERVLIITHDPLIQPMLAAACSGFSAEHNLFDHANIVHLESDGSFHWWMTPKLAKKLGTERNVSEIMAFAQGAANLAESLNLAYKSETVDPLIGRMKRALRGRWRRQAEKFAKGVPWSGHDVKFATVYRSVMKKAFRAGARHVYNQLAGIQEAKRKPNLAIDPDETEADIIGYEMDLDAVTGAQIRTVQSSGLEAAAIATAVAAMFAGFSDVGPDETSRAETVALHLVSSAYHEGGAELAKFWTAGGNGPLEKLWETEDDPCEECAANAEMDWIDSEAPFDTGDFEPPAHPNCRCSVSYRTVEESATEAQLLTDER